MTELTKVGNLIKIWIGVDPYVYLNIFEFADRFLQQDADDLFIDIGDEFGKRVALTDISIDGVQVTDMADFKIKLADLTKIHV